MMIDLRELVRFMDEEDSRRKGQTTRMISLVGEELLTALFLDYICRYEKRSGEVLTNDGTHLVPLATLSSRKEHRGRTQELDRWISLEGGRRLLQVEIKTSCAGAIGISSLTLSADDQAISKFARSRYTYFFGEHPCFWSDRSLNKLLLEMRPPSGFDPTAVEPALLLWQPVSPECPPTCHFVVETPMAMRALRDGLFRFHTFRVFSGSLYCRKLIRDDRLSKCDFRLPQLEDFFSHVRRIGFLPTPEAPVP